MICSSCSSNSWMFSNICPFDLRKCHHHWLCCVICCVCIGTLFLYQNSFVINSKQVEMFAKVLFLGLAIATIQVPVFHKFNLMKEIAKILILNFRQLRLKIFLHTNLTITKYQNSIWIKFLYKDSKMWFWKTMNLCLLKDILTIKEALRILLVSL